MIIQDKKRAMTTIMSKRNPKDGSMSAAPMSTEVTKNDEGEMDGRHSAAQDMMMAIHEKSPHKLMEAMANFHDLHAAKMAKPESDESEVE
jgi:hypothetical protein